MRIKVETVNETIYITKKVFDHLNVRQIEETQNASKVVVVF